MSQHAPHVLLAAVLAAGFGPPAEAQETRLAVAPGEHLHIVVAGEGTPVVLVPGLFGSAFGFRKLVGPLVAAGYRIGTAPHEGGINAAEIALLQQRLAHFSIDRVDAAGHFVFEEKPEAVVAAVLSATRSASALHLADGSSR